MIFLCSLVFDLYDIHATWHVKNYLNLKRYNVRPDIITNRRYLRYSSAFGIFRVSLKMTNIGYSRRILQHVSCNKPQFAYQIPLCFKQCYINKTRCK